MLHFLFPVLRLLSLAILFSLLPTFSLLSPVCFSMHLCSFSLSVYLFPRTLFSPPLFYYFLPSLPYICLFLPFICNPLSPPFPGSPPPPLSYASHTSQNHSSAPLPSLSLSFSSIIPQLPNALQCSPLALSSRSIPSSLCSPGKLNTLPRFPFRPTAYTCSSARPKLPQLQDFPSRLQTCPQRVSLFIGPCGFRDNYVSGQIGDSIEVLATGEHKEEGRQGCAEGPVLPGVR